MVVTLFSSCESNLSNQIPSTQESQRLDIAKNVTNIEAENKFYKLSFEEQKSIWSNKLTQIQSKNVSKKHNVLLNELNQELVKALSFQDLYNDNLERIAIELVKITPQTDFIEMFMMLEDYNGNFDSNNFKVCEECVEKLKADFEESKKVNKNKLEKVSSVQGICNCSWTCGFGPGDVSSNCKPTDSGCGFLWLSGCKKEQDIKP